MLSVRAFDYDSDLDYETAVNLRNANYPDSPDDTTSWRHYDRARDKRYFYQRDLFELDGRLVAYSLVMEPNWSYRPGKYFIMAELDPEYESDWLRTAVWDHMLAVVAGQERSDKPLNTLTSAAREDRASHVAFLESQGFERGLRYPESELNVQQFDASRFADTLDRVAASGIAMMPLKELMETDPNWQRKLYELECEIDKDIPSPEPLTSDSFEVFIRKRLESPNLMPEAFFIAIDGDQYVGLSALWRNNSNPDLLQTGLTGVLRSHRRRGIATALKVKAIEFAQAYGVDMIDTENEENNPMLQINVALGFTPRPAWLDFLKTIDINLLLQERSTTQLHL